MSEFFDPASAGGMRWDDPQLAIEWPLEVSVIAEKDRSYRFLSS